MTYFGCNLSNVNSLKYISMNNQELMKQDTEWYKADKCKCRLDASVCNNKQS